MYTHTERSTCIHTLKPSHSAGASSLSSEQTVVHDSVGDGGGDTTQSGEDPECPLQGDSGEGQVLPMLSRVSTATVVSVSMLYKKKDQLTLQSERGS